jgi:hypothetical protein
VAAGLVAAVALVPGDVAASAGPAQAIEGSVRAGLVLLHGQHVLGQELLAGQDGEVTLRVQRVGRQDPAGEGEPAVQVPQHGPDFRDLVRLGKAPG